MEFTAENLEKAISIFYKTELGQQAEAHKWLNEAQNSSQAWSFVWELLQHNRPAEVQFFAASTLHTKIMKHWNEVPDDQYEFLKKRILEAIVDFAMGPKIVLNRLCITLAAFIIHTVPQHWQRPFEELVSSFQPQYLPSIDPERVVWILLEILTVIPEEFTTTALATSHRHRVRSALFQVSRDILKVIEMCLVPIPNANYEISNTTTYLHAVKCASTWILLGGLDIDACSRIVELLVNLVSFVYWNRSDIDGLSVEEQELTEVAFEALGSVFQHPHSHRLTILVMRHLRNVVDKFMKIVDEEIKKEDINKDILNGIFNLIETTADNHCKVIMSNLQSNKEEDRQTAIMIIECLMRCTDMPGRYPIDELCSVLSFGFWYTLQDEVIAADNNTNLLLLIKPYYRRLVCVMLRKAMYPSDDDTSWSAEDRELFRRYRQDIADTYMYVYSVLNIETVEILVRQFEDGLAECLVDRQKWQMVESCLHAVSAVAECVEMDNFFLRKLMQMLKSVPYAEVHNKVYSSALECVGSYSEWFSENRDQLEAVIPLVVAAIGDPEVAGSATMALKDLSHYNNLYFLPYADILLSACQASLQSGNLHLTECMRIMISIGKILSCMPSTAVLSYLNVIVAPSFEEIQSVLSHAPSSTGATRVSTRLKMLSALFGSLQSVQVEENEKMPMLIALENMMPLFTVIALQYRKNAEVIEVLSNLLKNIMVNLQLDTKPMLQPLMQLCMDVFREIPQHSVLNVIKTAMILFGREEHFASTFQCILLDISNTTLQLCVGMTRIEQLSEQCDLIEAFFSLLNTIYKKVPALVSGSGINMEALFQCAVVCLNMPEMPTVKTCSQFLVQFISQSRENGQASIVQNFGENLVMRILLTLAGSSPRIIVEILTDILLALNKKYCDNLSRWLNTLLSQECFPTPKITLEEKQFFIKAILREKASKRKMVESVTDFLLLSRGIMKLSP